MLKRRFFRYGLPFLVRWLNLSVTFAYQMFGLNVVATAVISSDRVVILENLCALMYYIINMLLNEITV